MAAASGIGTPSARLGSARHRRRPRGDRECHQSTAGRRTAGRARSPRLPSRPARRRPKLTLEQVRLIPDFLWHGAEAYGFRGETRTCGRVAGVIREEFDVSYSKSQASRFLKHLGWTPQAPITRAIQRDGEAIARWRAESWPALKRQARRERRRLVFSDESGFCLFPGVFKTYAPRARTPRSASGRRGTTSRSWAA